MQVMNVDRLLFLHLIFFHIILITGTMVGSNCPGFPHTRDQPCMARNSTMGKQQAKLVSVRHCPDVETWERVAYPRERYESFTDRTLKNTSGQPISLCAHNAHAQPEYVNSSQYGRGKCEFLKKRGGETVTFDADVDREAYACCQKVDLSVCLVQKSRWTEVAPVLPVRPWQVGESCQVLQHNLAHLHF